MKKKGWKHSLEKPPFKKLAQWGLALLLVILLFTLGDVSQLSHLEVRWEFVLLVFLSNVGFTLAHNFRWMEIVENLSGENKIDFFTHYRYLIDSYAIGKIIPLDVSLLGVRSFYLTRFQKLPLSVAIFSVLLDRFFDITIFLIMAVPSFLLITRVALPHQALGLLVLLVGGQLFIQCWKKGEALRFSIKIYQNYFERGLSKVPFLRNRIKLGMEGGAVDYHFSLASVIQINGMNFIKYIFLFLRFYFTGQALGVQFPFVVSFFFLPLIQLSWLINITPGGLGVVEMSTYGALFLMGLPQSQILIFVFGQRILLISVFLALFALTHLFHFIYSRGRRMEGLGQK